MTPFLSSALRFALTLTAGTALGVTFMKLRLPSGLRIGAFAASAVLGVRFGLAWTPAPTRFFVQCLAGALIGCTMEKSDLARLPKILKPTLIQLGSLLFLNIAGGFLVYAVSPLDLVTSLMSVVPGGVTDTPVIAADMGADAPLVAILQLSRLILGISVFPPMILAYTTWRERKIPRGKSAEAGEKKTGEGSAAARRVTSKNKSPVSFVTTVAVSCVFGYAGYRTGLPAFTFVSAILAVSLLKLRFDFAYMPTAAKKCANVLSGCYIGTCVTADTIRELPYLALPLVIILGGFVLNAFVTGGILSRTCGFTLKEGMLICTPAGASDIALNSGDIGVHNTDVIVLQIFRAVIALAVFPQLINLILKYAP